MKQLTKEQSGVLEDIAKDVVNHFKDNVVEDFSFSSEEILKVNWKSIITNLANRMKQAVNITESPKAISNEGFKLMCTIEIIESMHEDAGKVKPHELLHDLEGELMVIALSKSPLPKEQHQKLEEVCYGYLNSLIANCKDNQTLSSEELSKIDFNYIRNFIMVEVLKQITKKVIDEDKVTPHNVEKVLCTFDVHKFVDTLEDKLKDLMLYYLIKGETK